MRESLARKETHRLSMHPEKRALFYKLLAVTSLLAGETASVGRTWEDEMIELEEVGFPLFSS